MHLLAYNVNRNIIQILSDVMYGMIKLSLKKGKQPTG